MLKYLVKMDRHGTCAYIRAQLDLVRGSWILTIWVRVTCACFTIRFVAFEQMDRDQSGTISFEEFESVLSTHENISAGELL